MLYNLCLDHLTETKSTICLTTTWFMINNFVKTDLTVKVKVVYVRRVNTRRTSAMHFEYLPNQNCLSAIKREPPIEEVIPSQSDNYNAFTGGSSVEMALLTALKFFINFFIAISNDMIMKNVQNCRKLFTRIALFEEIF